MYTGNLDAMNVHPFEFLFGEYLHLLTIYLIPGHIVVVLLFVLTGAQLASLNHTRLVGIIYTTLYCTIIVYATLYYTFKLYYK